MHQGMDALRTTGSEIERAVFSGLLAEAYGKVGQARGRAHRAGRGVGKVGQNWRAVLRGGAVSATRGADARQSPKSRVYKVQSYLDPQSPDSRPQVRSRRMFSQSHRHCSKPTSQVAGAPCSDEPGPLWQHQAKQTRSSPDVIRIYNWFTEGFDTKDLQEAKALLEELA